MGITFLKLFMINQLILTVILHVLIPVIAGDLKSDNNLNFTGSENLKSDINGIVINSSLWFGITCRNIFTQFNLKYSG